MEAIDSHVLSVHSWIALLHMTIVGQLLVQLEWVFGALLLMHNRWAMDNSRYKESGKWLKV